MNDIDNQGGMQMIELYKLPSKLASLIGYSKHGEKEWSLPSRAKDRNDALKEALIELYEKQGQIDALEKEIKMLLKEHIKVTDAYNKSIFEKYNKEREIIEYRDQISWLAKRINILNGNVSMPMYKKTADEESETIKQLKMIIKELG